jgi:pimeloyl-ACP methyl ester carboxylesterase
MPAIHVNGIDLYHEVEGDGPPLVVVVHGSWADHTNWQAVVRLLADSFRVVSYDRRGHSLSKRPLGPRTRCQDEDNLAALIESLDCGPAHVAGNSFGVAFRNSGH